MIREWMLPGLLETGAVDGPIMAVQDGLVNFYVARGPEGLVCVDSGWRQHSIEHGFKTLGLELQEVVAVFLTHRHWDHARGAELYPNARVFVGGGEAAAQPGKENAPAPLRTQVRDGQIVTAAGLAVRVIGAPGHTPDSVCYVVDDRFLFTGDALRLRRGKVVPFPSKFNQDQDAAKRSVRKLARLEGIERLLTAHTGSTCDVKGAFQDWRDEE